MRSFERTSRAAAQLFDARLTVGALAVVVFAVWVASDAGYEPTTWYPGALFLLLLALLSFVAYGRLQPSRPALVAIGCLAGFAAWCGLSVSWSGDQGIAWEGANRTLLYLVVYALFASMPWRREWTLVLLAALSLAVLGIGLADLARSAGGNTADFFIFGRLAAPAGYPNAACAVYAFSFWPLAYLAARRELPAVFRGALLAGATGLAELALLTQSRGLLYAGPAALVVYLVFVPLRLRAASALAAAGIAVLVVHGRLLDVFDAVRNGVGAGAAIDDALEAIGLSAAAVFVVWTFVSACDRRIAIPPVVARAANLAAVVLAVAGLIAGATVLAATDPGPRSRLAHAWHTFKAGYPDQTGSSRFSLGLGSNRYDFWRVALGEFRDHPVEGVGVDNFAHDYIRERRSNEEPLYPHSLWFRVPAQTGIVGTILFLGFVVAASVAAARGVWRRSDLSGGVARAGLAATAYFALHGSFDWFYEFPGLAAPALAWLGLAAGGARLEQARSLRAGVVTRGLAVVFTLATVATFLFPWLAALDARRAIGSWARSPARAFADLHHARALDPLSARPDLLAGAIASRLNDVPKMRGAFERAIERDDQDWYAHFELGLAQAALGQRRDALRELDEAARLNPRDEVVRAVRRSVSTGRSVDRARIDRQFVERVRGRVGP